MVLGWFKNLPFLKKRKDAKTADMLNGYTPIYSQFGSNIYASDVVQAALNCIISEIKKLNPTHVKIDGMDVMPVDDYLQRLLEQPNDTMTKSDFLEKIMWSLLMNYNAFILPCYYWRQDESTGSWKKIYTDLYPLQPNFVEFSQDPAGTLYITLKFANQYETTVLYSDIIHIKYRFSVNDYMGGNEQGEPDHAALLKTLGLNHNLLKGVESALKSSFAINGIVKYNTMMDKGKTAAALKEFEEQVRKSQSGFLPIDLKAEYIKVNRDIKLVDPDTLKFIDEKILRQFGVPLSILTGDYTAEQYEAFYQKTLEPIIISLSQAFTKTVFTRRERSYGHEIKFYPKDLIFMSMSQTLEMIRLLGDSGALFENEKRTAVGLRPLRELVGKRTQSLNYVDVDIASQYQMNQKGGEPDGKESDETGGTETVGAEDIPV